MYFSCDSNDNYYFKTEETEAEKNKQYLFRSNIPNPSLHT